MGKLIEAVKCAEVISEKFNIPLADLVDVFAEIPAADVAEVKRGEWFNIMFTQRYRCSLCGNEVYFGKDKFCSECGAKMDGTSKERGTEE